MRRSRFGALYDFRGELGWTAVVLVLAVLTAVALWPRNPGPENADGTLPVPPVNPPVDVTERREAQLPPCPEEHRPGRPQGGGDPSRETHREEPGRATGDLDNAVATCMANGAPVDVGAATAGKPTLINVWATWCAPCQRELPALQAYAHQPGSIPVLGVQVLSDEQAGLDLLESLGVHIPTVYDGDKRVSAALKLPNALPASYVVTPAGEARRIDPPVVFESPDDVRAAVRRTLEGTS